MQGLRLWLGEVFQRPLVKDQRGFHGLMCDRERAMVVSAGGSADCEIASEQIESYMELAALLAGTSESPPHFCL